MDSNPRSPLLVANGGETRQRWWWWVIDPAEAKNQIIFSVPMVLTNLAYFLIPLISVMFAGHLGELELAGATLANSWSTVTGFAFLVGLSGSLETLCGQAFGAKAYRMLGLYIQASSIISLFTAILITIVWWFTDSILILLHQNPAIAIKAGLYMKCYIPGVFAYAAVQNILRFLQAQSVIYPLIFCSLIPLALHIGIAYIMVHLIGLGFKGAPLAASISFWVSLVLLVLYLKFSKKFVRTWTGFSNESFEHVLPSLKLALPSAAMVCLEYWVFELLVLLAGLMPDSEVSTSVIAILVNTEGIAFMIFYGLSAAASTRVSNELGAGHPDRGKHAMGVTLRLAVVLALLVLVLLGVGHDSWAHLFSDSTTIIAKFAALTPFLCVSIFFDGVQSMLSGVCRGGGWQNLAMLINLGAFYCVGMPVACVLAFKFKFYAKGLWIGLISGLAVQSTALLILTFFTKWSKVVAKNDSFEP